MDNNLILNFKSPIKSITLTFEDNGKVAYAYLKNDNEIVGDVWLYNHKSIKNPEWDDIDNAPFLNPDGYIDKNGLIDKAVTIDDVLVNWEEEKGDIVAYIYLFEELCGVVGIEDKPGYARYAIKDNPLAKVLIVK